MSETALNVPPHQPDGDSTEEALRRSLKELADLKFARDELRQRAKGGDDLTTESRWSLVSDAAGQPRSVLVINTDVTARKKVEQQLLGAQRMESIGTPAGGIAHDLNHILAPILRSIQMLQLKAADPSSRRWLELLQANAERGADMVRQVLSFARGVEGERVAPSTAGRRKISHRDTEEDNKSVRGRVGRFTQH